MNITSVRKAITRRAIGVAAVVLALPMVLVASIVPNSVFYRRRRPTTFGKWTNRLMAAWYGSGTTPRIMSTLEVRRRRNGGVQQVPIVVASHDGRNYLVSMLGQRSEWVRNVDAARGEATIIHGDARKVRLDPVPVERRAPILKAYVRRAIGARPHIPVSPQAPLVEFERIAADFPVYEVTSASSAPVAVT